MGDGTEDKPGPWPDIGPGRPAQTTVRIGFDPQDLAKILAAIAALGGGGSSTVQQQLDALLKQVGLVLAGQTELKQGETQMAADLTALTAQVQKNTEVEGSAVVLLKGLADLITSLKNDPVAIQALADKLNGSATALADAITTNTPAA